MSGTPSVHERYKGSVASSLLELIGNTPVGALLRLTREFDAGGQQSARSGHVPAEGYPLLESGADSRAHQAEVSPGPTARTTSSS